MSIDDVSKTLGELVASAQSLTNQTRDQWKKLDEIERHAAKWEELADDIAEMKPAVGEFLALKQRGLGVLVGVGAVASGAGAAVVYFTEKFLGGGP
jgi:methyl-accepting chemotaxis protein